MKMVARQPPNIQKAPASGIKYNLDIQNTCFAIILPPTPDTISWKNFVTMKARVQLVVVAAEEATDLTCRKFLSTR